jgi:TonB-linked SusC/RagA family outer membrane protein
MKNKSHWRGLNLLFVFLLLFVSTAYSFGDGRKLTGKVSDQAGPIIGATIAVKGTTTGTISDMNGDFSITVPTEEAELIVSFIGYITKVVPTKGQSSMNILLNEDVKGLDEVVVIGYGTQKKSDLTGAISSVSSDELKETAVLGVDQALQGRAAGVQVTANSGSPGSGITVRIRGTGTIDNSDPLYVVDGIAMGGINSINPGDIESIEILKDAGAAAIYGSAAANGVVLITTKKGKAGATRVEFNAYSGFESIIKKYGACDANQNALLQTEAFRNSKGKNGTSGDNFWDKNTNSPKVYENSTDWQDAIYQQGKVQNYHLALNGGNEKTQFNFSLGYFDQKGIIKKSGIDRTTARLNIINKINDKITFGSNFSFSNTNRDIISEANEWGPITFAAMVYPSDSIYSNKPGFQWGSSSNNARNPVALLDNLDDKSINNQLNGNLFVEIDLLKGLKFKSIFGADYGFFNEEIFNSSFKMEAADQGFSVSELKLFSNRNQSFSSENTLTYSTIFAEKHNLTALAGYTVFDSKYYWSSLSGKNTTDNTENMRVIDATPADTRTSAGSRGEARGISYLGRLIYSYNDKYLLTASIRRDGSSKFGPAKRFGNFPSVTLGWKLSNEAFMKDIAFISSLKLRAGWGVIGNNQIGDYRFAVPVSETMRTISYVFNDVVYNGAAPASTSNPEVSWEQSVQKNIAMDASFFDNSLSLTIDLFYKTTEGMLLQKGVPQIVGLVDNPTVNAGDIENKGIEFETSYKKKFGDFNFEIGANCTAIKNTVLDIGDAPIYGSIGSKTMAGYPVFSFFGYKAEGIFQNYVEINRHAFQANKTAPGDVMFKDLNGDGKITAVDQTFIGNPNPSLIYGANLATDYKNFDISIFLQGTYGNKILNYLNTFTTQFGYNYNTNMLNRWTPENPSNTVPRVVQSDLNDNKRFSSLFIEDGSYYRIKNIQLGYTLPAKVATSLKMQSCRVYISGDNLLTVTKYSGLDPEIGKTVRAWPESTKYEIGVDRGNYPQAKKFLIGLNITF